MSGIERLVIKMTIEQLRDSRNSYAERLFTLLLNVQKYPEALYCVYEGEDAKYYDIRIQNLTIFSDRKTFPCKGKADVLKVHELVISNIKFTSTNIAFFIDKDFDGLRGNKPSDWLYITPCYSIENLYLSDEVVSNILRHEFGVHEMGRADEADVIMKLYTSMFDAFIEAITPLNAWLSIQRELESQDTGQHAHKLNLANCKLNNFVDISLGGVVKKYEITDLEGYFPDSSNVLATEVEKRIVEFKKEDRQNLFRGKYLIEFLRLFLTQIRDDASLKTPKYFNQKKTIPLQFSKKNIISELSQYAITPDCLKQFLARLKPLKI